MVTKVEQHYACVCFSVATGSSINYEESFKSSIAKALARFLLNDGAQSKSAKVVVKGNSFVIRQLKQEMNCFTPP